MWEDLLDLSQQMREAWCILGDFNVILYKEDRRRGDVTQDKEIEKMSYFIEIRDLQEMRWSGAYYSCTNKIIWSRIDKALINIHWCEVFDFTQNHYLASGFSNHTLMLVKFPLTVKPRSRFQFYEMWCRHQDFNRTVDSVFP